MPLWSLSISISELDRLWRFVLLAKLRQYINTNPKYMRNKLEMGIFTYLEVLDLYG